MKKMLSVLCVRVFPFSFDSFHQARNILLVCRATFALREKREFWTPLLSKILRGRVKWMEDNGHSCVARLVTRLYQMFPPCLSVLEAVRSKLFFSIVRPASVYTERLNDDYVCEYSATGAVFFCRRQRLYHALFPSGVSVSGQRSSDRVSGWRREGPWVVSGKGFRFEGVFSSFDGMSSSGKGVLKVGGEARGEFRTFNWGDRGPVSDSDAIGLGFANRAECFILYFGLGELALR